jgi:phosphonate transport system ATP-binding protein
VSNPFLDVSMLRLVYPNGHEALKSVSFQAQRGEIIAIIGRSGAGKSTLLRCINGLEKVSAGRIMLDGETVTGLNERDMQRLRAKIGFVWQEYNLVERLPVMQNVLTGRLSYNSPRNNLFGWFERDQREIAVRSLERVNMLHRANYRSDRISGGEKQRVSIARALTQQPKIILADEPVASLDPALSAQVIGDLARVAREDGTLTIINIHQVDLARKYCDRMIGLAQGVIVFDGTPDELNETALNRIYRFDHSHELAL